MKKIRIEISSSEEESWEKSWKWKWFTREQWMPECWVENQVRLKPLLPLLRQWQVGSMLDCSCGLGMKTILFVKAGFKVKGSDASPEAISHAPELAKEEGQDIKFFLSRYDELGDKCRERFDCIYSDNFDETEKYEDLVASAKGIYSALKKGGRFVFTGAPVDWSLVDLKNLIEEDWKKRKRFEILPPHEKDGLKVTTVHVTDKTPDGFLVNYIYLIEEQGEMRVEIVPVMDPRIKWTFKDYVEVLEGAGFSRVECVEQDDQIFNIGIK